MKIWKTWVWMVGIIFISACGTSTTSSVLPQDDISGSTANTAAAITTCTVDYEVRVAFSNYPVATNPLDQTFIFVADQVSMEVMEQNCPRTFADLDNIPFASGRIFDSAGELFGLAFLDQIFLGTATTISSSHLAFELSTGERHLPGSEVCHYELEFHEGEIVDDLNGPNTYGLIGEMHLHFTYDDHQSTTTPAPGENVIARCF